MFKGSIVALVTPFTKDQEVDYVALEKLINWHVQEGSDAIVLCGTTGESPTLSDEERNNIFKLGVRVAAGRIPIIAGTGTNDTRSTVKQTEEAKEIGVDGCLVIAPYYNRPTTAGCFLHYKAVSAVGLPTVVYHHPGRTGITLNAQSLAQICSLPNIVGVKEASGSLELSLSLRELSPVPILCGDDTLALSHLKIGGHGCVSIVANLVPKQWASCISKGLKGDWEGSREIYDTYENLCQALVLEVNPQGIKYALSLLKGTLPSLRLPLIEPEIKTKSKIQEEMSKAFLI